MQSCFFISKKTKIDVHIALSCVSDPDEDHAYFNFPPVNWSRNSTVYIVLHLLCCQCILSATAILSLCVGGLLCGWIQKGAILIICTLLSDNQMWPAFYLKKKNI